MSIGSEKQTTVVIIIIVVFGVLSGAGGGSDTGYYGTLTEFVTTTIRNPWRLRPTDVACSVRTKSRKYINEKFVKKIVRTRGAETRNRANAHDTWRMTLELELAGRRDAAESSTLQSLPRRTTAALRPRRCPAPPVGRQTTTPRWSPVRLG